MIIILYKQVYTLMLANLLILHLSQCLLFKNANNDAINDYLSAVNWTDLICRDTIIETKWSVFLSIIHSAINSFVPVRTVKSKIARRKHIRQFYPLYIRRLYSKQLSAWKIYKRTSSIAAKTRYILAANTYKRAVDYYHTKRENDLITSGRVGDFYKYVNNKVVSGSGIPTLSEDGGAPVVEDEDKAEILNRFFHPYSVLIMVLFLTLLLLMSLRLHCVMLLFSVSTS